MFKNDFLCRLKIHLVRYLLILHLLSLLLGNTVSSMDMCNIELCLYIIKFEYRLFLFLQFLFLCLQICFLSCEQNCSLLDYIACDRDKILVWFPKLDNLHLSKLEQFIALYFWSLSLAYQLSFSPLPFCLLSSIQNIPFLHLTLYGHQFRL